MDHMRISGNEPSSVILLPNKVVQKLKSGATKVPNQAEAKRDGVINPKNKQFISLFVRFFRFKMGDFELFAF